MTPLNKKFSMQQFLEVMKYVTYLNNFFDKNCLFWRDIEKIYAVINYGLLRKTRCYNIVLDTAEYFQLKDSNLLYVKKLDQFNWG